MLMFPKNGVDITAKTIDYGTYNYWELKKILYNIFYWRCTVSKVLVNSLVGVLFSA